MNTSSKYNRQSNSTEIAEALNDLRAEQAEKEKENKILEAKLKADFEEIQEGDRRRREDEEFLRIIGNQDFRDLVMDDTRREIEEHFQNFRPVVFTPDWNEVMDENLARA